MKMRHRITSHLLGCFLIGCPAGAQTFLNNELTPEEVAQGFELLFDGKKLTSTQWVTFRRKDSTNTDLDSNWRLFTEDSSFGLDTFAPGIRTIKKYGDFEVRFDFRFPGPGRQGQCCIMGFYYRMSYLDMDHPALNLDYFADDRQPTGTKMSPGSLFDIYPPKPATTYHTSASGLWNHARLVAKGDSVEHWLNGTLAVGYRVGSADFRAHLANSISQYSSNFDTSLALDSQHPLLRPGYLGWLGSWTPAMHVRNLKVAPLPLRPVAISPRPATGRGANHRLEGTAPGWLFGWKRLDGRRIPALEIKKPADAPLPR